jgi:antitoxin (DNA-binding transcriptional repressor) of toxin-antitoxin stability system
MTSSPTKIAEVGIREFRAGLAGLIDAGRTVTVTRRGKVVGLFLSFTRPSVESLQRLREASDKVQEVMPFSEQEVEEIMVEFKKLRRNSPIPAGS